MDKKLDDALRQALAPCEEADFWLNQKILNQAEEQSTMEKRMKRRLSAAAIIAVSVLSVSSVTVYAAWKYLPSSHVAENMRDIKLAEAFSSEQAVSVHETQSYGEYRVTLLSIISGELLSEHPRCSENGAVIADRTYAVIAIERADGEPLPDTSEEEYDKLDLSLLLQDLFEKYNINSLIIQSGGNLNGLFLRENLIDYVNIIIAPLLVGGKNTSTLIDGESIKYVEELDKLKALELLECNKLNNSYIQLKYKVVK